MVGRSYIVSFFKLFLLGFQIAANYRDCIMRETWVKQIQ